MSYSSVASSPIARNPTRSSETPSPVRSLSSPFTSAHRSPVGSEACSHSTQPASSGTNVKIRTVNAGVPVVVAPCCATQITRWPPTDTSPQSPSVPGSSSALHATVAPARTTGRMPSSRICPSFEIAGASPGVGVVTTAGWVTATPGLGLTIGEGAAAPSSPSPVRPNMNPTRNPMPKSTIPPATTSLRTSPLTDATLRPGRVRHKEDHCYDAAEPVTTAADLRAAAFLKVVTWARVALVPAILALILAGPDNPDAFTAAAVLFAIAALTDFFDGLLARRWAQGSVFGNFLDTTAGQLLGSGALVGLLVVDRVSPWVALVIIGREVLIIGLKGAVASTGDLVQPSIWGKAKANVQFMAILLAILRRGKPIGPLYLDEYAMIAAAVITVLSGAEYLMRFRGAVTGGGRPPPGAGRGPSPAAPAAPG